MKKLFSIILAVLLLTGCAAPAVGGSYRQINMNEAIAIMEKETGYIILDVRTPSEFMDKHIPGAINIPNETIGTEQIPELPDKNQATEANRHLKSWWRWVIPTLWNLAASTIGREKPCPGLKQYKGGNQYGYFRFFQTPRH